VVKGGKEAKCVGPQWEQFIGSKIGRECPRVDLWPTLTPDAEVLEFALSERLRPALGLRAELVGIEYGLGLEETNAMLTRVAATLSDPDVSRILNPKIEEK